MILYTGYDEYIAKFRGTTRKQLEDKQYGLWSEEVLSDHLIITLTEEKMRNWEYFKVIICNIINSSLEDGKWYRKFKNTITSGVKNYETLGGVSQIFQYHGTIGHISECIVMSLYYKINRIFIGHLYLGRIISNDGLMIEYLEKGR